jgi:hypothetical protein
MQGTALEKAPPWARWRMPKTTGQGWYWNAGPSVLQGCTYNKTYMRISLLLAACVYSLYAQPTSSHRIDTVAGTLPNEQVLPAVTAILDYIQAIALGKDGVLYVGSGITGIRKITLDGIISPIPGAGRASGIPSMGTALSTI